MLYLSLGTANNPQPTHPHPPNQIAGVGIKPKIPPPLPKSPPFSISHSVSERLLEEASLTHRHSLSLSPAGLRCRDDYTN
ncbi:hypothetical protein AAC387_Pa09g0689 [Persea americana]